MHWSWAFLVATFLAGCSSPGASTESRDPTLVATFENQGDLGVHYDLVVRLFQEGVRLEEQHGEVVWSTSGNLDPGDKSTDRHTFDGRHAYWVEMSVDRVILAGGSGLEFHMDPKSCDGLIDAIYTAENSVTSWGGDGRVVECGQTVIDT